MSEVPAASPLKTIIVKPEVALELGPRDMLLDSAQPGFEQVQLAIEAARALNGG